MIGFADRAAPLLVTPRLLLRALDLADAPAVAERAGDRRVARFLLAVPTPYPVPLAQRWILARIAWWAQRRGVTLAVTRRGQPRELLGSVSLRCSRDGRAELGYWLGHEVWGQGYATEACEAVLELGFRDLRLDRIWAQVIVGNDASCRVLAKLGMTDEGIVRAHVRKGRRLHDVTMFGMSRTEWRAR